MKVRLLTLLAAAGVVMAAGMTHAAEYTFKLHHLLSGKAPAHTKMLEP